MKKNYPKARERLVKGIEVMEDKMRKDNKLIADVSGKIIKAETININDIQDSSAVSKSDKISPNGNSAQVINFGIIANEHLVGQLNE